MLGSVHSESLDAQANQIVDVVGCLLPDVVGAAVQVIETDQVAVSDLVGIIVVVDVALGLMEVIGPIGHGWVVLQIEIEIYSSLLR